MANLEHADLTGYRSKDIHENMATVCEQASFHNNLQQRSQAHQKQIPE